MKKGFTILEMIAVITLLAVIFALIVPNINKVLKKNTDQLYKYKIEELIDAAELYVQKHEDEYDYSKDSTFNITIEDLYNEGFIPESTVIDPRTNQEMEGYIKVTYCVTLTNECDTIDTFVYKYIEV